MLSFGVPPSRSKATVAALAAALAVALLCAAAMPAAAGAGNLAPQGKKLFFGISDTGDPADFGAFSKLTSKHPALIETFLHAVLRARRVLEPGDRLVRRWWGLGFFHVTPGA